MEKIINKNRVKYDRSGIHIYNYHTSLDTFMGTNPPCKECLIQSMCINNKDNKHYKKLVIRACNELTKFTNNNYWFDMS